MVVPGSIPSIMRSFSKNKVVCYPCEDKKSLTLKGKCSANVFPSNKKMIFSGRIAVFLTRKMAFLIRKMISLIRNEVFLIRNVITLIRKMVFLIRNATTLIRKMVFLIRNKKRPDFSRNI